MKSTTAHAVIAALREMWARFGLPRQVVSDNGPPFTSTEFEKFLTDNGVEHIFSAPYHPASNGAAEVSVKICKRVIKKAQKQNINIDTALNRYLLTYRNTEHYTTGESPAKLLQGRKLRMRLDKLKPDRLARISENHVRSQAWERGARRALDAGDTVWYRDYRTRDKWLAGSVVEKIGQTDYKIGTDFGTVLHRHVDQLKRRVTEPSVNIPTPGTTDRRLSRSSMFMPVEETVESSGTVGSCPVPPERAGGPAGSRGRSVSPSRARDCEPEGNPEASEGLQEKRIRKPPLRYGFEDRF